MRACLSSPHHETHKASDELSPRSYLLLASRSIIALYYKFLLLFLLQAYGLAFGRLGRVLNISDDRNGF